MTGLAGLIDALLAARLAPRLDVLGIKGETSIGAPGPAVPVGKVENDVRLPSNAALDRQIPGGLAGGALLPGNGAQPSVATRLSVAARVIGAVLADLQAAPGPVRGAVPLMVPGQRPIDAGALAGTLARTVSDSGLFYESHLASFAAGGRTLAQMTREPQARWAGPVVARPAANAQLPTSPVAAAALAEVAIAASAASAADLSTPGAATAAGAGAGTQAGAAATNTNSALGNTQANAPGPQSQQQSQPQLQSQGPSHPQPANAAGTSEPAPAATIEAARLQAAYRQPDSAPVGGTLDSASPAHRAGDAARQAEGAAATQAARGTEVIHPQAVTLVHQQLDLLAGAVFRWSGHAWPEVPMAWSIAQEREQDKSGAREGAGPETEEEGARRWSTTVSLQLPRLGEVDLRLSVAGPAVQAHLWAREPQTTERLRGDAGQLAQRFEAAGLQLQQLLVAAKAGPEPVAAEQAA
jgi:hypothetical protein